MTESLAKVKSFRYFEKFYKIYLGGGISHPPPPSVKNRFKESMYTEEYCTGIRLVARAPYCL